MRSRVLLTVVSVVVLAGCAGKGGTEDIRAGSDQRQMRLRKGRVSARGPFQHRGYQLTLRLDLPRTQRGAERYLLGTDCAPGIR